jgi:hypothetical protein
MFMVAFHSLRSQLTRLFPLSVFTALAYDNFVALGVFSVPEIPTRTTIDNVEVLRFYVIWAYLGCRKDLPRSQELLNVAPKGKLCHGLNNTPIQNKI